MGLFGPDLDVPSTPGDNGWGAGTSVRPGQDDPAVAEWLRNLRLQAYGSTDPVSPQTSRLASAASNMASATAGHMTKSGQQQQVQQAPGDNKMPSMPGKPVLDPQLLASLTRSPFAPASAGPAGAPKPAIPKIYQTGQQSPFGAA